MNMVLEKKLKLHIRKDIFPCLFTQEWVKQIPFWNFPKADFDL